MLADGCTDKAWPADEGENSFGDYYQRISAAPIIEAARSIGGASISGTCPTLSVDTAFIRASTRVHCEVFDSVKHLLSLAMIALYSLIAVRIVLSA
jgi:hypothetical protein